MALEGTLRMGCHGRSVPVLRAVSLLHTLLSQAVVCQQDQAQPS